MQGPPKLSFRERQQLLRQHHQRRECPEPETPRQDRQRETPRQQRQHETPRQTAQPPAPSGPQLIDWTGFETPQPRPPSPQRAPPLCPEDEERMRCEAERRALETEFDPCQRGQTPRRPGQTFYDELLPGDRERIPQAFTPACPNLNVFDPVPQASPEVVAPFDPIPECPPRRAPYFQELAPGVVERPGFTGVVVSESLDIFAEPCPVVEGFDPFWTDPAARQPSGSHFRDLVPEWGMYTGGALIPPPAYHHPDYLVDMGEPDGPPPPPCPCPEGEPLEPTPLPYPVPVQAPVCPPERPPSPRGQAPQQPAPVEQPPPVCPPARPTRRNQFQTSISFGDQQEEEPPQQRITSRPGARPGFQQEPPPPDPRARQQTRQRVRQDLTDLVDWNTELPGIIQHPSSLVPQNLCPEVPQQQQQRMARDRSGRTQYQRPVAAPDMIQLEEAQAAAAAQAGGAASGRAGAACPPGGAQAPRRNLMQTSINWGEPQDQEPCPPADRRKGKQQQQQAQTCPPAQQAPQAERAPRGRNLMQPSSEWGFGTAATTPRSPPPQPPTSAAALCPGEQASPPPPKERSRSPPRQPQVTAAPPPACPPPAQSQVARGRQAMMHSSFSIGGGPEPPARCRSPPPACPRSPPPACPRDQAAAAAPPPACPPPAQSQVARGRQAMMQSSFSIGGGPEPPPRTRRSPPPSCPRSPAAAAAPPPVCPPAAQSQVARGRQTMMQSSISMGGGPDLGPDLALGACRKQRQIDTNPFERDVDPIGTGGRRKPAARDDFNQYQAVKDAERRKNMPVRRRVRDDFNTYSTPDYSQLPRGHPQRPPTPPPTCPASTSAGRPPSPCPTSARPPSPCPAATRPPSPCPAATRPPCPCPATPAARPPSPGAARAPSPRLTQEEQCEVAEEVREVVQQTRQQVNEAIQKHKKGFVDHSRFF